MHWALLLGLLSTTKAGGDMGNVVTEYMELMGRPLAKFFNLTMDHSDGRPQLAQSPERPYGQVRPLFDRPRPGIQSRGHVQVILLSYPNSGTTWLKRLFEDATGVAAMSHYKNEGNMVTTLKQCDPKSHPWGCKAFFKLLGDTGRARGRTGNDTAFVKSHRAPRSAADLKHATGLNCTFLLHTAHHAFSNSLQLTAAYVGDGRNRSCSSTPTRQHGCQHKVSRRTEGEAWEEGGS